MAVMSARDREEAAAEWMRKMSRERRGPSGTKSDAYNLTNAADQWISDNWAAFDAALTARVRGAFTRAEKAEALLFAIERRVKVGA